MVEEGNPNIITKVLYSKLLKISKFSSTFSFFKTFSLILILFSECLQFEIKTLS